MIEEKSAKRRKGMIVSGPDGKQYFLDKKTGLEYRILHMDLSVKIIDKDAYFKEVDDELYLDYSNRTLGLDEE